MMRRRPFYPLLALLVLAGSGPVHAAVRLADGRVVVLGGYDERGQATRSIEIYDAKTNTFSMQTDMVEARVLPTAALLPDGRVLIAGGSYTNVAGDVIGVRKSTEIFDPATGKSVLAPGLTDPRLAPIMVLLRDGPILVAGGQLDGSEPNQLKQSSILGNAELLDPATGKSSPITPMSMGRVHPRCARVPGQPFGSWMTASWSRAEPRGVID